MRQDHRGGEKLFVDYGEGLSLIDPQSGEPIKTQLFVAVWGASNYSFAEATLTQQLPDWIGSHVCAFEYFGCLPKIVVPDCLKSAVSRACRYEPDLNPTYAEMASHYGICVLPARPAHPKDKAKVETGVLIAKRWILAVLRHRTFYSLAELNGAIHELLERLNTRALRKLKKSRRELFELFDQPGALERNEKPDLQLGQTLGYEKHSSVALLDPRPQSARLTAAMERNHWPSCAKYPNSCPTSESRHPTRHLKLGFTPCATEKFYEFLR